MGRAPSPGGVAMTRRPADTEDVAASRATHEAHRRIAIGTVTENDRRVAALQAVLGKCGWGRCV